MIGRTGFAAVNALSTVATAAPSALATYQGRTGTLAYQGDDASAQVAPWRGAPSTFSPELDYARLVAALEDAKDVEAFDVAIAEEGANIPWDQAKADLGWE